ncbi:MAG: carboxylating nicotinate-nucleotide diphosphorylase [Bacteroidetes bacterium]|nr:carboxylating nicotinate-nucleotide diphosphorylase [Bacteroidota bacterium]
MSIEEFIQQAILEDIQDPKGILPSGDHSALACIPADAMKKAHLKVKQQGIIAGIDMAKLIFENIDANLIFTPLIADGSAVKYGDIAFYIEGSARSLLLGERLILNTMQRMSGIATLTYEYANLIKHTKAKVLDTRKTCPNFRYFEKLAVKLGGGENHRFGLYDMIMLKDNHIDYCGGITQAIEKTKKYLIDNGLNLKIEVETRSLDDVKKALNTKMVDRIMVDNFSVENCKAAVEMIGGRVEVEASGGINLKTIVDYAETGVDFISIGALTHSYTSLDMSLKAI